MKKSIMSSLAVLALGLSLASTASAAFIGLSGKGTTTRLPGYSPAPASGEFTFTITSAPAQLTDALRYTSATSLAKNSFQTFCLELDEPVANAGDFIVNSFADNGGANTDAGDPLSAGTAWLYSQFARGVLANYDYVPGAGREASAGLLQEAIWGLEDEIAAPAANPYYILGLANGGKADAEVGANSVYVLNITRTTPSGTFQRQDFLIHVPEGGSTFIVLGLALCGLSVFRSRLQKNVA
jgi:hypothetical protein